MLFCVAVWEYLWGGKFPFNDSDTVKVERSQSGYYFHAAAPGAAGKSSPTQSDFAGVYVNGATYNLDEWVVVQAGPVYGAYISTMDGNTNAPWTGLGWINFSSLNQWF